MKTLEDDFSAYLEHIRARGVGRQTLRQRRSDLFHFLEWIGEREIGAWEEVTPEILEVYFLEEASRPNNRTPPRPLSRHTLAGKGSSIRGLFKYLVQEHGLLLNPARNLRLGKRPNHFRQAPGHEVVARLLEIPGTDPQSLRLRAILEVLYSPGIRRAELCGLNLEDVDWAGGALRIHCGKGGKSRIVPIGEKALKALRLYLERSRPLYAPRCRALFVAGSHAAISKEHVSRLVREWAQSVGIQSQLGPHHLRHAFATHLLERGAGIVHVQAMLGHSRVGTTQRYTHVGIRRLREALDRHDIRASLEESQPLEPSPGLGRLAW